MPDPTGPMPGKRPSLFPRWSHTMAQQAGALKGPKEARAFREQIEDKGPDGARALGSACGPEARPRPCLPQAQAEGSGP